MTRLGLLALLWLLPLLASAADKPDTKAGDAMIDKYLAGLAKELSGRFLDGAKTRDEWEKKLPRLRREYLDMLGLWPLPEKTPLNATVTGTLEHEGVVIEKLHFQSQPGLYVTAQSVSAEESVEAARSCRRSSTSAATPSAAATATRPPIRTTACGSPTTATSA